MGAILKCKFGSVSTPLAVLPVNKVSGFTPYANINDHIPFLNVIPFGICNCPGNPAVLAAKLIGQTCPCTPMTLTPWSKAAEKVKVGNGAAITKNSKLNCIFGGEIKAEMPGQLTVTGK